MMNRNRWRQAATMLVVGMTVVVMSGCSTINRLGANTGLRFTENHVIPPILTQDDVQMACVNGEALSPVIYAVGDVPGGIGADNDQLSVLLFATSALCAEQNALENELRYMRASRGNAVEEAQDARIAQKRWAALASRRQYHAYQAFTHYYETKFDTKIGEKCPKLDSDFDQLVFLLGAISGIQAVVNDINSQSAVGVPKDIAAKVERAMTCLDNDKYWGVPMGVRAAIWNLLPGSGGNEDPWATMKASMAIGQKSGVRMAYALYTISAYAKADDAKLRDSLKQYAATQDDPNFVVNPKFKLLDKFADQLIMGVSDRYWTEHTGARTPAGSVGHFWDENQLEGKGSVNVDDLL